MASHAKGDGMQERQPADGSGHSLMARVSVPDLQLDADACVAPVPSEPCSVVILGATGDLTSRKLMPALFSLYRNRGLPEAFLIVGCGRTQWTDEEFRRRMAEAVRSAGGWDPGLWQPFSSRIYFRTVTYDDARSVADLAQSLRTLEAGHSTAGNRIFYLALPPHLYQPAARHIGQAGLSAENREGNGWARIVLEKPFGTDLETSRRLDQGLHEHFGEHQIFRIDHYLAKETVQNILMFRFANSIFEPIWNRRYIDYVSIRANESLGVEHRSGYYESAGVLRDMFQNHMMQLLSLTAMEPPPRFEAELVRDEKAKVFSALRPFPLGSIDDYLVLGQYTDGSVEGRTLPAYREEAGVDPRSLTPTYAAMKVYLDNWRWQGVPFFISSGKRLAKKRTEIAIQFKAVPHSMFRNTLGGPISANRLILGIYPHERITLTFQTKNPGAAVCLRTVTMDFNYHQNYSGPLLDAYEKALLDCMLGDHMLFWRQDGVELSWAFLSPVLDACETCGDRAQRLHLYAAGSKGPVERNRVFRSPAAPNTIRPES
jgi:glucose-6-phosphate 1-dehydrogenase